MSFFGFPRAIGGDPSKRWKAGRILIFFPEFFGKITSFLRLYDREERYAEERRDMKKCPYCGAQLSDEARSCVNCMRTLQPKTAVTPESELQKHKKRKKLLIALVAAAAVLLSAAAVLFAVFGAKGNSDPHAAPVSQDTGTESAAPSSSPALPAGQEETPQISEVRPTAASEPPSGAPTHEHSFGEWTVVREARCAEEGLKERVCSCGTTETEAIPAPGHKLIRIEAIEPTCTYNGHTEGTRCAVCKELVDKPQILPPYGHQSETVPAVAPTCTQEGKSEGSRCRVCGVVLSAQQRVSPLGHDYGVFTKTKSGGCTETERYERSCSRCGKIDVRVVQPKGHTIVADAAVAPSCTSLGRTAGSHCSACGEILTPTALLPALGHDFKDGVCTRCRKQTGNAGTAAFDVFKSFIWLSGRREGDSYRSKRDALTVDGKNYDYVWIYTPDRDAICISLSGTEDSFSVTLVRKQTYLSWDYDSAQSGARLSGIMDFDRFDLNAYPLPYCRADAADDASLEKAQRASSLLAKALWKRAGEDASALGISLENLG